MTLFLATVFGCLAAFLTALGLQDYLRSDSAIENVLASAATMIVAFAVFGLSGFIIHVSTSDRH